MIAIKKTKCYRKTGGREVWVYDLWVNDRRITTFTHARGEGEHPLAECLRDAANAVEKTQTTRWVDE